ncbi:PREDICTED: centrosomal protein of 120 kDa-like isoform X2 [Vollenhovia emeryi]|uniref:centrosomal protein of 120 kDa-like isoform X2 n=1 Tax=Vollenhovia emeryi TaxID=411798 RepID=UPI0005F57FF8|nr:PREDICTED: centrosomal protein of 120 kDa-like isoform X2 [Vollenhovia emeryi]
MVTSKTPEWPFLEYFTKVSIDMTEATTKSDVQIILGLKEGKGFEQVLQPTLLVGTLNGHSLETDRIESCPTPQYATNLVWETNKVVLRRMRSEQASLKLECFAFKENEGRERIGYVLLNIRSAQVLSKYGDLSPKASWYKLLGLRSDLKIQKPELLLALRVEDRKDTNLAPAAELRNLMIDKDVILESDKIIPYLHPDEQLIQLGPVDTCCELFILSITAVCTEHLHLLLPEYLNKCSTVRFLYQVLENDVELTPFKTESGKFHFVPEKVVVRIRSSLSVLKQYLQLKPDLLIHLKHESNVVAESSVNLQSLVPADSLQEFLRCTASASTTLNEQCFLIKQNSKPIENQHQKSYLDLQLKLQYIGSGTNMSLNSDAAVNSNSVSSIRINCYEESVNNIDQRCPEIESHRNPSGDFGKPSLKNIPGEVRCTTECKNINKQSVECFKHQMDKVTCSRSCCDAMFSVNKNHVKGVGSYHCYCLRISLVAVTLVSETLCGREIEFRFYHPRTEVISTAYATMPVLSNEKVKLQDIVCQFHLISAPDEIKQLLQSFPLKISIYDTNRDDELSLLVLDVKPLFHQEKSECQYKLSLLDTDRNKIADIDIILKLEDRGPHCILKKETIDKNLGPPILDDSLAYKIVDELETWKERQKEMFKDVLKKKEDRHLNMLSEEWRMQKENLELKLAYSVEQCKTLANSLNSATEDLRKRRLKSLENETRLIKANEDLQCRYKNKLQELQDTLHATRNDLTTKVAKLEEKKVALEAQVEILSYENENLKSSISKQMDELKIYQKGSLTQDQTASLLQEVKILEEKLDNAQKGKEFFREQWGKAVRELHRMKVDYQETMQVQIKNSREELMSADLAEILSADRKALNNDQMLLNELQKEIDVIKPKQSFAPKEAYNQIFTTAEDVCYNVPCKSNKTVYDKSKEYSERLQALRGEHESLLKTGNYTDDDVVIKKLDAEIRLLMSR